ncbi:endoplasmic reticulum-Golgi intermediate compartment protein 3-like isoform X2 [Hydractinia symbiolongicarpus]|uniref:endoplasmic reticulum-Golgi intermediate compartment protein 3-like isoform X2 n=1 Tax=Hydractinia symbiolongicarpus TaxID=13093 RepID=UPI00254CF87C|nr:endoplasmic reticulum-Golgi intermediate compartment protein 3-like isoform X2 [Hydractinia symbiolongicarpus]
MDGSLASRLKQFDAYPKTLEDFRVKTFGGALVTGISSFIMFILFISEFNYYLTTEVHPELFVDTTRHQKLRINIDVFFPKLGCAYLSIDAMDVSGEQQSDLEHNIFKKRFDEHGKPIETVAKKEELGDKSAEALKALNATEDPNKCESCYGAETTEHPCCNTCEEVRTAYRKKGWAFRDPDSIDQCKREHWKDSFQEQMNEGCQVYGYIEVSKVAGNFHIAPGKSFQQQHVHVHDLQPFGAKQFNVSHDIRTLSFGVPIPNVQNPLDGTNVSAESGSLMYQYFVKIVPTVYKKLSGEVVWSNQYSFTKHRRPVRQMSGEHGLPGFFVLYELSPMLVQYTEKRRSFMHFLTGVCAIIGGVFTVAGLIDSMIYHSAKALKKKIDLGKAT